jgi:hypothetical protein
VQFVLQFRRGKAQCELEQYAAAKEDLVEAARAQPNNRWGTDRLGFVCFQFWWVTWACNVCRTVRAALKECKEALAAKQAGRLSSEGERELAQGLAKMIGWPEARQAGCGAGALVVAGFLDNSRSMLGRMNSLLERLV